MDSLRRSLLSAILFIPAAWTLRVTPGSPCTSVCQLNANDTDTTPSEIACLDSQFNATSGVGSVFHDCITCELQSTFANTATFESDVGWALCECLTRRPPVFYLEPPRFM
jgi:hypothetical protein